MEPFDRLIITGIKVYLLHHGVEELLKDAYHIFYTDMNYFMLTGIRDHVWNEQVDEMKFEVTVKRFDG